VPDAVLATIGELILGQAEFDRVSVGFPGVVLDGITRTAPNLENATWAGYPLVDVLSARLGRPVRVANDADIQGLAAIEGRGLEMLITLGTGLGSAMYVDGRLVPNLELGHHPFRRGKTYEDLVSNAERKRIGKRRWNRRVRRVIAQIAPIFNYRRLYIGGGNARHLIGDDLPENVSVIDNVAGLLGGVKLWA
jgi:polyphosphate glucokinase